MQQFLKISNKYAAVFKDIQQIYVISIIGRYKKKNYVCQSGCLCDVKEIVAFIKRFVKSKIIFARVFFFTKIFPEDFDVRKNLKILRSLYNWNNYRYDL